MKAEPLYAMNKPGALTMSQLLPWQHNTAPEYFFTHDINTNHHYAVKQQDVHALQG